MFQRAQNYSEMHRMISTVRIFIHENRFTSKTQRNTLNISLQEKSTLKGVKPIALKSFTLTLESVHTPSVLKSLLRGM